MLLIDYQSKSYQRFLQDVYSHVCHPKRFLIIFNGANEEELADAMNDIKNESEKNIQVSSAIKDKQSINEVNALFEKVAINKQILLLDKADLVFNKAVAVKNSHAIDNSFDLNNFFKNTAKHQGMVILANDKPQILSSAMSSKVDVVIRF